MTAEFRHPFLFLGSLILAAVLAIVPLPLSLAHLRPEWLALVLFYWTLRNPAHVGIMTGWCLGLVWDVLTGTVLGLHALALALQAYLVSMLYQRLQMYPLLQQALVLFLVVGIELMFFRWMNSLFAYPAMGLEFLWASITTAVCWFPFVLVMRKLTDEL